MKRLRQGFLYYLFATLLVGCLLMFYIVGDTVCESMDVLGWVFYITSCLSHAAIVVLVLSSVRNIWCGVTSQVTFTPRSLPKRTRSSPCALERCWIWI